MFPNPLNNNSIFLTIEYVYSHIPEIFIPYLEKIKADKNAILTIFILYKHITDVKNQNHRLQNIADKLLVSRNTLIRIFYVLEEIDLFECHYIVKNKYEGKSFNKEISNALGLDIANGKHIFIFSTLYNDIQDWLNTPVYIKKLYIRTTTLSFYKFTNELIVELRKHPLDRTPFGIHSNTLKSALKLLIHHGVIRRDFSPCGYSFVHKYKLTPTAKTAIDKEMAENTNPNFLKRGDWQEKE